MTIQAKLLAEKVGLAFIVAFVTALSGLTGFNLRSSQQYVHALDVALLAAVVALVTGLITVFGVLAVALQHNPLLDVLVRTALQFLQNFAGFMSASGIFGAFEMSWTSALSLSVIGALPTLLKALVAIHLPTPGASIVSGSLPARANYTSPTQSRNLT
jgi:hypothetical protein